MKNGKQYNLALEKEIKSLTEENSQLRKLVRQETLSLMKDSDADSVIKKARTIYTVRNVTVAVTIIICTVLLTTLVISFMKGVSVSLAKDDSLSDPTFIPDTTENLNINGSGSGLTCICAQNGIFYYAEDDAIYRNNGDKTLILNGTQATFINVYQYCIYYYDKTGKTLCRLRTDGQNPLILTQDVTLTDVQVYKGIVFSLNAAGELYSIYIDGKRPYPIKTDENIVSFVPYKEHIYYITEDSGKFILRQMGTNGANPITVTETDSEEIASGNGYVYYIKDGTLYGFSQENEKAYAFFAEAEDFAFINGRILILSRGTVYSAAADGTDIREELPGIDSLSELTADSIIDIAGGTGHAE